MSRYDEILTLPHPVSPGRARMSRLDRAAQFAPFAALTGFGAEITETARLTEARIELDGDELAALDKRLQRLRDHMGEQPEVTITYFVPDGRKAGGAYRSVTDRVRRLDPLQQTVTLLSGAALPMGDILSVEGELFQSSEGMETGYVIESGDNARSALPYQRGSRLCGDKKTRRTR